MSLARARAERAPIRSRLSKINSTVFNETSLELIEQICSKVETLKLRLEELDKVVCEQIPDTSFATDYAKEAEESEKYDTMIMRIVAFCKGKLATARAAQAAPQPAHSAQTAAKPHFKSPNCPLPKYNENLGSLSLLKFLEDFKNITQRYEFSDFEYFCLLKQQIRGRALQLVEALPQKDQSFAKAEALLKAAFASPSALKHESIKRLLSFKRPPDAYAFATEMKLIMEEIDFHKISIEDVMQFCFLQNMPEPIKAALIQITNTSYPSLSQISENVFSAIERSGSYLAATTGTQREGHGNTGNSRPMVTVNAVTTGLKQDHPKAPSGPSKSPPASRKPSTGSKKPRFTCTFCTKNGADNAHASFKCPVYPTPDQKLAFIVANGGCEAYGYFTGHKAENCTFNFKQVCKCNGRHFRFLCGAKSQVLSNSVNVVKTNINNTESDQPTQAKSLLPTFTVEGRGGKVRCLLDTASELTICSEKALQSFKHNVIKQIEIDVEGFNGIKHYSTNLVNIYFQLGNSTHCIQAIVKPDMNTKLYIPILGQLVAKLHEESYILADELLDSQSTCIDNIGLILGADFGAILPITAKRLYTAGSMIFESTQGILLSGHPEQLLGALTGARPKESAQSHGKYHSNMLVRSFRINTQDVDYDSLVGSADDILEAQCQRFLNVTDDVSPETSELNLKVSNFILDSLKQLPSGRLQVSLPWKGNLTEKLSTNYGLARAILDSNFKKLSSQGSYLQLYDNEIQKQLQAGVVEKIPDFEKFRQENLYHSFLAHMGVFRPDKSSTKCRVVFLSNLAAKGDKSLSHNQCLYSGPTLNKKLQVALTFLRVDKYLMVYDLKKAFSQIALSLSDQNKLLFLWYTNVAKNDFTVQVYKTCRVAFGLPPSPCCLMLCLYRILVLDAQSDPPDLKNIKLTLYHLFYVDNGGFTTNSESELLRVSEMMPKIFANYGFETQQWESNSDMIHSESASESVNLLGMLWNKRSDKLCNSRMTLDPDANTKRKILSSIMKNFDIFNIYLPMLNRARIFMQDLQNNPDIKWDHILSDAYLANWSKIAASFNKIPPIEIDRFIGQHDDRFVMLASIDASGIAIGLCVHLFNVSTKKVTFLCAKNQLLSKRLKLKTIPSLELFAISYGLEAVSSLVADLMSTDVLRPLRIDKIMIFSDSLVALNWVHNYSVKFKNFNSKNSVFVKNKLSKISEIVERTTVPKPISFRFLAGSQNPSDATTREVSYKQVSASTFWSGKCYDELDPYADSSEQTCFHLPIVSGDVEFHLYTIHLATSVGHAEKQLIPLEQFSSFKKLVSVHARVLQYVNAIKTAVYAKNARKFAHIHILPKETDWFQLAKNTIISLDQKQHYSDCFEYFGKKDCPKKKVPNIMKQLNVFRDENDCLKIRAKNMRGKDPQLCYFPILLHKESRITTMIITDLHHNNLHCGKYQLLREFRKEFWTPQIFSLVKSQLKACIKCQKYNARFIQLNQNDYRDFRINPPNVAFRCVFLDYFGPMLITYNNEKIKCWVLCITCVWSRAINFKVCLDQTVKTFLKAFQTHIFEFGLMETVFSDLGSQIIPGANIIETFLSDIDTKAFLQSKGISGPKFSQYFKGNSALGSMIESLVKIAKKMIYTSVGKTVLTFPDFQFLMSQVQSIMNRRPIAFKEFLRDSNDFDIPVPVTPEMLIRGCETIDINVVPALQPELWAPDPNPSITESFQKLQLCRERLIEKYNEEHLSYLMSQATSDKCRYAEVSHRPLRVGDIVLIREPNIKFINYPMGVILNVFENSIGEVTHAVLKKGSTNETIKRHTSQLKFLFSARDENEPTDPQPAPMLPLQPDPANPPAPSNDSRRPRRRAAQANIDNRQKLINDGFL